MPPKKTKKPKKQGPKKQKAQPNNPIKIIRAPVSHQRRAPQMSSDLAAYAAISIDPLAEVRGRIPDSNGAYTTVFRSVTTVSQVATNGYINVLFNPKSVVNHYNITTATDVWAAAATAATSSVAMQGLYNTMRVVSAGVYVIPNATLAERVGVSYCYQAPRGAAIPVSAEVKAMPNTGPNILTQGCFLRWHREDDADLKFEACTTTDTNGPNILLKIDEASATSTYTIRFVVNYEVTVKTAYHPFIVSTKSPSNPDARSRIDTLVGTLPADSTVAQMQFGGPNSNAAALARSFAGIANGAPPVGRTISGKGSLISDVIGWIGKGATSVSNWLSS